MREEIEEMIEILESLLDDAPHKIRVEITTVINLLKQTESPEDLVKVQDQLEYVANMSNVDMFISTEIYNTISIVESLL